MKLCKGKEEGDGNFKKKKKKFLMVRAVALHHINDNKNPIVDIVHFGVHVPHGFVLPQSTQ